MAEGFSGYANQRSASVSGMTTEAETDEDRVWLVRASDIDRGELISRMVLPCDAERSRLIFEPTRVGILEDGKFEVWIVDDVGASDDVET